jgi:hypothetical protein
MEQNYNKTCTTYHHGEPAWGAAWYYNASYDETTGRYCTYKAALISFPPFDRRHSPFSSGFEGSNAALSYAFLKTLHEEQEAAKDQEPTNTEPFTAQTIAYLQSWINFISGTKD